MMSSAVDFLRAALPPLPGWSSLVAIHPDSGICTGRAVSRDNVDDVEQWLDDHEKQNLYWTPNTVRPGVDKKPGKRDITGLRFVHLDLDEPTADALARLRSYRLKPTFIIFSGGGYQAFWQLAEPLAVHGHAEALEAANRRVLIELSGDKGTHNYDRIMRLPGTTNWPTEKKRQKGRVPVEAKLVEHHPDRLYQLTDFDSAPAAPPPAPVQVKVDQSVELLKQVGVVLREQPQATDDDIQVQFAAHPHVAKLKSTKDRQRAIQRCIEAVRGRRAELTAAVNEKHALIWVEGKLLALFKDGHLGSLPQLCSLTDLKNFWRGTTLGKDAVEVWLDSPGRDQFRRFVFKPGIIDTGEDFNLWRGWAVEPHRGDCSRFLHHIETVICDGDADLADYVMQWLANLVQQPADKPGTALAMGSEQGSGKGAVIRYLRRILGPYSLQLSGSEILLGRFNDLMAGKLLIFGDEACWPNDRRGVDKLKAYITEEQILVERKSVPAFEIENHARFIFATNHVHSAPAEFDDRRFVVLPVSNARKGDSDYWNGFEAERNGDGPAALLHHLLHEIKLTRNLRVIPKGRAHTEQKLMTLDAVGQWWREQLQEQQHFLQVGTDKTGQMLRFEFGQPVAPLTLYEFFSAWCRTRQIRYFPPFDSFGRTLRRYSGELFKREVRTDEARDRGITRRTQVYELPTLAEARERFESALGGQPLTWDGVIEDEDGAP